MHYTSALVLILETTLAYSFIVVNVASRESRGNVIMSLGRRDFIETSAVAIVGASTFSQSASAAKYFGDKNDYPEVIKPTEAIKKEEAFGSPETKTAINDFKTYKKTITDLQEMVKRDEQADIRFKLKASLDYSKLRNSLNLISASFEEDSQRGIDRIVRIILQDITELEEASRMKSGMPRNQRRIDIIKSKLIKLNAAFEEMETYF